MVATVISRYVGDRPPDLEAMLESSRAEGHQLVGRTLTDWEDGTNRFDRNGEVFFVATEDERVIGMCGLNVDPFAEDPAVGRLRHLYVLPEFRRLGVGQRLVASCLSRAQGTFSRVRVRTFDPVAADFYSAMGFEETAEETATHRIDV